MARRVGGVEDILGCMRGMLNMNEGDSGRLYIYM